MSGGGTEVVATHGDVHGPGHEALLRDGEDWLIFYHYYSTAIPTGTLGINHVAWSHGWPRIV
jgi:arabinan endo-1,5-alpha-L-arabinosidase